MRTTNRIETENNSSVDEEELLNDQTKEVKDEIPLELEESNQNEVEENIKEEKVLASELEANDIEEEDPRRRRRRRSSAVID